MFDRLVCMNGGNPDEELINHKGPQKAIELERSEKWKDISLNHLEGRTAAFFCYGDLGGDELDEAGRPKILKHRSYFSPATEPFKNERDAYTPLVWQCRYGGIEVPDHLWHYEVIGEGKKYSEMQSEHMIRENKFMVAFEQWTNAFISFVQQKGKVTPGKFRAYGHKAPSHFLADIRDGINYLRMMAGKPADRSPAIQHDLDLNKDATWHPKKEKEKS